MGFRGFREEPLCSSNMDERVCEHLSGKCAVAEVPGRRVFGNPSGRSICAETPNLRAFHYHFGTKIWQRSVAQGLLETRPEIAVAKVRGQKLSGKTPLCKIPWKEGFA